MPATRWELPYNLQEAVDSGALSMWEASTIEDCSLASPEEDVVSLPQRLWLLESELPALGH